MRPPTRPKWGRSCTTRETCLARASMVRKVLTLGGVGRSPCPVLSQVIVWAEEQREERNKPQKLEKRMREKNAARLQMRRNFVCNRLFRIAVSWNAVYETEHETTRTVGGVLFERPTTISRGQDRSNDRDEHMPTSKGHHHPSHPSRLL